MKIVPHKESHYANDREEIWIGDSALDAISRQGARHCILFDFRHPRGDRGVGGPGQRIRPQRIVVSHAILTYNHGRKTGLADGIVITPSHNPPYDGGFKYNPPNGGPAEDDVTTWIEAKANEFLENGLRDLKRIPFEKALRAPTTHRHDFLNAYITDLANVIGALKENL